jgi:hypothetical protein
MKCYKLTDEDGQTKNNTQWGENISHTAKGESGLPLCSDGWIHFYTNPLLAVFMNPVHANFKSPRLWEAETSGEELHGPLKSGCKTLTTIKEIPLPEVSITQKIAFGILCAKEVDKDETWNKWADKWLSGENRTVESADAAYAYSTHAACYAAYAYATHAAAYAVAAYAVYAANAKINFVKIAEKAMNYK